MKLYTLSEWAATRQSDLTTIAQAWDPMTMELVNVSITSYTDDVKELNLAPNAQEAIQAIARRSL